MKKNDLTSFQHNFNYLYHHSLILTMTEDTFWLLAVSYAK